MKAWIKKDGWCRIELEECGSEATKNKNFGTEKKTRMGSCSEGSKDRTRMAVVLKKKKDS